MLMKYLLIALFSISSLTIAAQVPGQPEIPPRECDCPLLRVTDSWCHSKAVFLGTVTASDTIYKRTEVGKWDRDHVDHITVGFIVDHVFKGDETAMKNIHTGTDGRHCGYNFLPGEKYLVFAYEEANGQLTTDRCTSTRPAEKVGRQFSDSLDHLMQGGTYEIAGVDQPGPDCDR
jgi:hypothetical protein